MIFQLQKIGATILTGAICMTLLAGCASTEQKAPQNNSQNDSESVLDTYKPSELVISTQEKYEDPYMGIDFTLPKSLMDLMDQREMAMVSDARVTEDNSSVIYALYTWNTMSQEQLEAEVPSKGNGFYDWVDELGRIGALGVYHTDQLENLDQLTKCSEHKELGKSDDGAYTYYLSINPDADKELTQLVEQIKVDFTEMIPVDEIEDDEANSAEGITSLGEFSLQDITGATYTNEMFGDYKLTMINVFTTWCSPCISEIPDLEKLHKEMLDQGVQVVGVVLDAVDSDGSRSEEVVEKAKLLAERTGASYPFLIPDADGLNGRVKGIQAVPETFFVDKDGTIVGTTYSGSHSLEDWKKIVETELDQLKGEQP